MELLLIVVFSVTILFPLGLGFFSAYDYLNKWWHPLMWDRNMSSCHDPFDVPSSNGKEGFITKEGEYNDQK